MRQKKSINQINAALAANSTIQLYKELSSMYDRGQHDWRLKSYNYKDEHGREFNVSPKGTFIFGCAQKYYTDILGLPDTCRRFDDSRRRHECELSYNGFIIYFDIILRVDMEKGVEMQIREAHNHQFYFKPLHEKVFKVRASESFDTLDIQHYFERMILPKFFFAPGRWRHMQIVWNLAKSEVIPKYKQLLAKQAEEIKARDNEEISYKAIVRRLRKKKRLIADDWIIPARSLQQALNNLPRQDRPRKLRPFPNPFQLLDQLSSDYDTDDEIMSAAEDIIIDDNVIFI